jgi:hypothetical protein
MAKGGLIGVAPAARRLMVRCGRILPFSIAQYRWRSLDPQPPDRFSVAMTL